MYLQKTCSKMKIIDLFIVTNKRKTKGMETKFKEGDAIRIKSLDWYNNNKDKNGSINVTGYSCSFTKALSEFCGKCFVISKIEGTNFYLNDLSFVFYEWMFEPEKYELKPLDITKNSFGTNNPFIFNAAKMSISVYGIVSTPLYIAVKVQEAPKFQPFQKVLVKDMASINDCFTVWSIDFYSYFNMESHKHRCLGGLWDHCVPYEGNEHLLGTREETC